MAAAVPPFLRETAMAHTLALVCTWSQDAASLLARWRRRLPALLVTAITLLDAHGVAAASDSGAWHTERTHFVAQLQATPDTELRRTYLHCADVSNDRLLTPDESILCVL